MTRKLHRNKHHAHKDHKKLFVTIGLLIILSILAISSSGFLFFKKSLQKKPLPRLLQWKGLQAKKAKAQRKPARA